MAESCSTTFSFSIYGGADSAGWICPDDIVADSCNAPVFFTYPVVQSEQSYTIIQTSGLCSGSVFPLGITDVSFLIIFADGSTQFCSFDVIVDPMPPIAELTPPSCNGEADGKITLTSPDISDYYLFWKEKSNQMGPEVSGLEAGTYQVRGANKEGCVINEWIVLGEPDSLHLTDAVVLGSSSTEDNGQIQITVQGGTYPYTYQWTGPEGFMSDQEDLYQVGPGNYMLTVVDTNGCSLGELTFEVEEDVSTDSDPGLSSSGLMRTTVYPNPSDGRLNLNVKLQSKSDLQVTVFDQIIGL